MRPAELHVYDFDGTLYRSKKAPDDNVFWYMKPESLSGAGLPGFDGRWDLSFVGKARYSILRDDVLAIVCTARVENRPLRARLEALFRKAELPFSAVHMSPVHMMRDVPGYKVSCIQGYLSSFPSLGRVVFCDDEQANLDAVARACLAAGTPCSLFRGKGF